MNIDISIACQGSSPDEVANIPKAKETERYPRHIGTPSRIPIKKLLFSFILKIVSVFVKKLFRLFGIATLAEILGE